MTTPEKGLRQFIDQVYCDADARSPISIASALFSAARKEFSFSSGTYLRFDPVDWTVTTSYMHDIGPELMRQYSDHYVALDPYRIHLPNLRRPNEVVRMSDFVDVNDVFRGEFGEAMRLVKYFHCMAIMPVVRGVAMGAFAVHRPRSKPDFCPPEQAIFRWFVTHAARAMDHQAMIARLRRPGPIAMVIAPEQKRIVALTEEAKSLVSRLGEHATVMMPAQCGCANVWMVADTSYVARAVPLNRESLLQSDAVADLSFYDTQESMHSRVRFPQAELKERTLVLIEPLDEATQSHGGLGGFGLTPRQEEVALLMILGKGIKDIAQACGISGNTAKEYVADVYQLSAPF